MTSSSKLIFFALTLLALAASTFAQAPSPREQFQTAVAACQQTANGANALAVIKLYLQLDPPPAVLETAREPFVMGATILKKASNPVEASKAVDLFTQSLAVTPWFAEAYYNRALARETAGQFTEAMADLKLYLEFKLTETERREAQDKIYALKADAQLAITKKTEEDKAAAAKKAEEEKAAAANRQAEIEKARQPNFKGIWKQSGVDTADRGALNSAIEIVEGSPGQWKLRHTYNAAASPAPDNFSYAESASNVQISGRQLTFRVGSPPMGSPSQGCWDYSLNLSEDGSRLTGHWVYTQYDTSRGIGFWAKRGQVSVVFIR